MNDLTETFNVSCIMYYLNLYFLFSSVIDIFCESFTTTTTW